MKLVIIGGTAAGTSVAAKARRNDPTLDIVLYEKSDTVSFGACGLPYFIGGYFADTQRMVARTVAQFQASGIAAHTHHEVLAVDSAQKTLRVKDHTRGLTFSTAYDRLVIASGSTPLLPPFQHRELENIFTLKTLQDGQQLKRLADDPAIRQVIIVGAGFIGLELADTLHGKDKAITVIQLDPHVLPEAFDPEISTHLEQEMRNKGIRLLLAESVRGFEGQHRVEQVITDKGRYPADLVVICTGVRPNTGFLADSGIALHNGAVMTDPYGETNIPGIFAAGDCALVHDRVKNAPAYVPLATVANKLGRIVGQNVSGERVAFPGTLASAAIKVLDIEAARTGLSEKEAAKQGIKYKTVVVKDKNPTDYLDAQFDIHTKIIYEADSKIILGAQMAGRSGAVMRIGIFSVAIHARLTTTELGFLDLAYAPPFARTWDAVNTAANAAR